MGSQEIVTILLQSDCGTSTFKSPQWDYFLFTYIAKEVFPLPPMVAYKRPKNIREKLIRSKVPPERNLRPKRKQPGCKKCNKCNICPYIKCCKNVKSTATGFNSEIMQEVGCQTKNIIYCITCKECKKQYIVKLGGLPKRGSENIQDMLKKSSLRKPLENILTKKVIQCQILSLWFWKTSSAQTLV